MKTLIYSDFTILKSLAKPQILFGLFMTLCIGLGINLPYILVPITTLAFCLSLTFYLGTFDENNNWQKYRFCLPLSSKQIVLGRYISVLLASVCSIALGLVVYLLGTYTPQLFGYAPPPNEELLARLRDMRWDIILLLVSILYFSSLTLSAILLPLASRFGVNQALRLSPLAFILIVVAGIFVVGQLLNYQIITLLFEFFDWIMIPGNSLLVSFGLMVIACTLYALSFVISTKLYEKREF